MRAGEPLRVFFVPYENSLEMQGYLSYIRLETEAFTSLIRAKGVCTPPPTTGCMITQ